MRFAHLVSVVCIGVLLSGCAKKYRLEPEARKANHEWPYHRGDAAATASIANSAYDGSLDVLWEAEARGKPVGPLTISNGVIAYPSARERLLFYRLSDGAYLGRLKVGGVPQTGLAVRDSLGFVGLGPRDNRVVCFDLKHRDERWRQSVKDATGGTILVEDRLLVASTDGTLYAFDADSGDILWTYRDSLGMAAPPVVVDGRVFQTLDDGYLVGLEVDDGRELFRTSLTGPVVSPAAVDGLAFVASKDRRLHAVHPSTGQVVWQQSLDGDAWNSPAVAKGVVVCGHSGGGVEAFSAGTGEALWHHDAGAVVKAGVTIAGETVVAGTMSGRVITLDLRSGRVIARRQFDGAVEQPPVTDGKRIVITTRSGHLSCLGTYNDAPRSDYHRRDSGNRLQRAGALAGPRTGYGHSQSRHLWQRPSHGHQGR